MRKLILLAALTLVTTPALCSDVYFYDGITFAGTSFLKSVNTPDHSGCTNCVIFDVDTATIRSLVDTAGGVKYTKFNKTTSSVEEMTQLEKDAVDTAEQAAQDASEVARIDSLDLDGQELSKALVDTAKITETELTDSVKQDKGL